MYDHRLLIPLWQCATITACTIPTPILEMMIVTEEYVQTESGGILPCIKVREAISRNVPRRTGTKFVVDPPGTAGKLLVLTQSASSTPQEIDRSVYPYPVHQNLTLPTRLPSTQRSQKSASFGLSSYCI